MFRFLLTFALLAPLSLFAQPLLRSPNPKPKNVVAARLSDPKASVVQLEFMDGAGTVLINGHRICVKQTRCMGEIPMGEYEITLSRDGYLDSLFLIKVPSGTNYYATALREKPGVLNIKSIDAKSGSPVVASVFIDDKEVGKTPWTGPIEKTVKSVALRAPWYSELKIMDRPAPRKEMNIAARIAATSTKEMKKLRKDCFEMGSEDGRKAEMPVHKVCLNEFYMDQFEVTHSQYRNITGDEPSFFAACGDKCPVESVNWKQAKAYCERVGKRLPTEAEWEYAARAGSNSKWGCGFIGACVGGVAWYKGNSDRRPHPVGERQPNSWGLYDMQGNVSEWTADWYGETYYAFSIKDSPKGANGGVSKVARGGSWDEKDEVMMPSARSGYDPNFRETTLGFRCAMDPQPE